MKTPTDSELNLAMCEWMGWTDFSQGTAGEVGVRPDKTCWDDGRHPLPNYLSDDSPRRLLNEAEARLTNEQQTDYLNNLYYGTFRPGAKDRDWQAVSSTARQRVIAILQTVKPELFQ